MRPRERHERFLRLGACLTALLLLAPAGAALGQSDDYLNHARLGDAIQALVSGSDAASVTTIGASHEGRDVWLVTVGAPGGAPLDERPGVLIVGNLEGDHLVGSALALETIRHLLGSDEAAEALSSRVFYIVPRLNPDGAEAMFADVLRDRRGNARPYDDDNDGRTDEDPGEDLNGDGHVTMMRVEDPYGEYVIDGDDPRLMRRADAAKGERGTHTVYFEGRDDDGDGFYNEDGAGGVDLNRNFQHAYPYWQPDAGPHMISEPETRALMDFVIAHRNIGAILTFSHSDNLVTPPNSRGELGGFATSELLAFAEASHEEIYEVGVFQPRRRGGGGFGFGFGGGGGPQLRGAQLGRDNDPSSGRRPATTVNGDDLEYFNAVSSAYGEATGISAVAVAREPEGAFFQYGYYQFGVPSFSTPGWGLSESTDENGGSEGGTDGRLLAALGDDAFVPWSAHEHPQLGTVEIGGFRPYATANPEPGMLAELGAAHGAFAVQLAGMLADTSIVGTEVTAHGGGIFTVSAEIENSGYFPTALAHGLVSEAVDPVTVQIGVEAGDVLTGHDKSATIDTLAGSGGREKFTWVIRGEEGDSVEIRLISQKGGHDTATVTLR